MRFDCLKVSNSIGERIAQSIRSVLQKWANLKTEIEYIFGHYVLSLLCYNLHSVLEFNKIIYMYIIVIYNCNCLCFDFKYKMRIWVIKNLRRLLLYKRDMKYFRNKYITHNPIWWAVYALLDRPNVKKW